MSEFRPSRRLFLMGAAASAVAPPAFTQTTNNLQVPLAVEKLLGSPAFQIAQAAFDQGIPEEVFVVSAGGNPKIAQQVYQNGQKLVAVVAQLLPLGTRALVGASGDVDYVAQLLQAADRLNAETQPFLPRLKEAYSLQYAANDTNPTHAVIGFAARLANQGMWETYAGADLSGQGYFWGVEDRFLTKLAHRDPKRMNLKSYSAYRQYLSRIADALTRGQRGELTALEIGTNNYPNIGQDLAQATIIAHQNLDGAKQLLSIPVSALDANPGVTRRPVGAGLIGLPYPLPGELTPFPQ